MVMGVGVIDIGASNPAKHREMHQFELAAHLCGAPWRFILRGDGVNSPL
jgi:hypothetical protein